MMSKPTSIANFLVATLASSLALSTSPAAAGGQYVWMMDGKSDAVSRVSGGGIRALVETTEVDGAIFKEVVGLAQEDVVLDLDLASLPGSLADWINESWERGYARRSGSWAELDDFGDVVQAHDVVDAHITELRFPKLDASSAEPAPVELRISSDLVEDAPAASPSAAPTAPKQKNWQVSNFDLEIDGFGDTNAIQIDEFVVRLPVDGDDAGGEISNLVMIAGEDTLGVVGDPSLRSWVRLLALSSQGSRPSRSQAPELGRADTAACQRARCASPQGSS